MVDIKESSRKSTKKWTNSQKGKKYLKEYFQRPEVKAKRSAKQLEHYHEHKNEIDKVKQSLYQKEYYLKNKEKLRAEQKKYRNDNKEKIIIGKKRWYQNFNSKDKLNHSISGAIFRSLKGNKNGRAWESLVDYTLQDLIKHLKSLFVGNMSLNNYGKWHVDHIKPKCLFDYNSPEDKEFKKCWALSNLQPLWAKDNLEKSINVI